MNTEQMGDFLKKQAKPNGNFVNVNFSNTYNLLQSLAYFFYRKHHEWVAICFLDETFNCNKIWFNKGPDQTTVCLGLSPEEIIKYGIEYNSKYIIIAHNHPASSKFIPQYSSRLQNIKANKLLQEELFDFSEQDFNSMNYYSNNFQEKGFGFADVVYVAGNYKIYGDEKIINNFNTNKIVDLRAAGMETGCLINIIIALILLLFMFFF